MSFFSAEARDPTVADLAGVLCGHGRIACFARTAARLSVVVDEVWRAEALAAALVDRGIEPELSTTEEGTPLVRTAFRTDLIRLASAWTTGSAKVVPPGLSLDGPALRLWVLVAGRRLAHGYLLGLDPAAPNTYESLAGAVALTGLPVSLVGVRDGGPGLRVAGRRRLARLGELVGTPPGGVAERHWPTALVD